MKRILLLIFSIICANADAQKFDKLALTPPMGWNSWNRFACDVNEKLIRETADAMVASGMKDAGYLYVNLDDCWHGVRDSLGFIHPDPQRFPAGMKALADYLHSKGLKFGIYSDAGWKTCAGRPASRGHEYQDALTYAQWGIDYLKYDWCNTEGLNTEGAYLTMREALFAAGRPIVFSICEWGSSKPWEWGKKIGHLWRTTGDITACWDCEIDHGGWSSWGVMRILDMQKGLRQHAGPGHWNDPDMMEVGNGMAVNEDRAHFSMWCMLAAPLIAGNDLRNMSKETVEILTNKNDLRNMSKETVEILTNKEVIAVNQDSLGIQGVRHSAEDDLEIWLKPLVRGDWAMCVLNRKSTPKKFILDWKKESVGDALSNRQAQLATTVYRLRNLWTKKDLGTTEVALTADIPGHDVLMLRLSKK